MTMTTTALVLAFGKLPYTPVATQYHIDSLSFVDIHFKHLRPVTLSHVARVNDFRRSLPGLCLGASYLLVLDNETI